MSVCYRGSGTGTRTPSCWSKASRPAVRPSPISSVPPEGVEPPTFRLKAGYASNCVTEAEGLACIRFRFVLCIRFLSRCLFEGAPLPSWGQRDSNLHASGLQPRQPTRGVPPSAYKKNRPRFPRGGCLGLMNSDLRHDRPLDGIYLGLFAGEIGARAAQSTRTKEPARIQPLEAFPRRVLAGGYVLHQSHRSFFVVIRIIPDRRV